MTAAQQFVLEISSLLMNDYSLDGLDENRNTALRRAVGDCDPVEAQKLLGHGANKDIDASWAIREARSPHQYAQWMEQRCQENLLYWQKREQSWQRNRTIASIEKRLVNTKKILALFIAQDKAKQATLTQAVKDCNEGRVALFLESWSYKDIEASLGKHEPKATYIFAFFIKQNYQERLLQEMSGRQDFYKLLSLQEKIKSITAIIALLSEKTVSDQKNTSNEI